MDHPVVSIICNVFNHEKYVRDALEGFIMQKTTFPFEVLVHDDASTDRSAEIIREYEEKYPEIIKPIYQTVNQYSRKVGITKTFQTPRAKGKYIAMCEGDDYWTDSLKLQKQFDFMESHPEYSLCACSTDWLDMRSGKVTGKCKTSADKDVSLEEIILETHGRIFQYGTIFAKAEVFINRPDWSMNFGVGDTPVGMYAATIGKIRMLADPMTVYRNHAPGSWTAQIEEDAERKKRAFRKMMEGFRSFNEATEGQYETVVNQRIGELEYKVARLDRDWKALRSPKLRTVYHKRSFAARVSDFMYCKAPGVRKPFMKLWKLFRSPKNQ